MRNIPPDLAAALESSATTLCHCWRLTRRDGAVLGFTDHDCDLAFGGATFRASAGLDAAQAESATGFAVGGGDVQGALVDGGLEDSDLASGLYDDASVEVWLVDWSDVSRRVLMDVATIGEVRRTEFSFVAELRSIAHCFDQEHGRQFQRCCSADLGDDRCKAAVDGPDFSTGAAIVAVEQGGVLVLADTAFEQDFFTNGVLTTNGQRYAIKLHEKSGAHDRILLWSASQVALTTSARVNLQAGCDKSPETCQGKFANIVNFRGFPHMPGNDVVVSYPNAAGAPMDGGSLFQ
jgi:uncharacterized phage protein (TIGR02218 family)